MPATCQNLYFKFVALIDDTNDHFLKKLPVFWHSVRQHTPDERYHLTCDHVTDSVLLGDVRSAWKKPEKPLKRIVLPKNGDFPLYQNNEEAIRFRMWVMSVHKQDDWALWPGFLEYVRRLQKQTQKEIHLDRAENIAHERDLFENIENLTLNNRTRVVIVQRSQYPKFGQGAYVRVGETFTTKTLPLLMANSNLERKDYL